jgi:hypothetical protein
MAYYEEQLKKAAEKVVNTEDNTDDKESDE